MHDRTLRVADVIVRMKRMSTATQEDPELARLRAAVFSVCKIHPVTRVELFGSRAKATMHAGSDVDLLIEFAPEAAVGLFEMGAIKEELEAQLGRRVDLVSRAAIERSANAFRRRSILAAPVPIYAR